MANVLPPEAQKKIRNFYRIRFAFAAVLMAAVLALISLIALLPSYIVLRASRPVAEESLRSVPIDRDADLAQAQQTEKVVTQLRPVLAASSSPLSAIAAALEKRPKGILVTQIAYSPRNGTIVLSGESKSREAINQFRQMLVESKAYKNVNVPVGDLVGTAGSQFTVTLTLAL